MKHQLKFNFDYCEAITSGNAVYEGFLNIVREATNHPKWQAGLPILIDHRGLDFSRIGRYPKKDTIASIQTVNKKKPGGVRIAVLLSPDSAEPYSSLWQTINRYFGFQVHHKVFLDKDEAIHWLMSKKGEETPFV